MNLAERPKHPLVILIDDNETDNFIAQQLITNANFGKETLIFKSTKDALEKLIILRSVPDTLPSCIFLDINIADENGLDFLYELNTLKLSYPSPLSIFILTNCTDSAVKAEALLFKTVKGWIQKPLKVSDLNIFTA
ncbi:MAG: Response regulator [Bacteroidetes bacterium]|jgi:response regulator RpfG family c-di-GMP phosphodiesterase|nr:Response regulator [Bacteroidota bacterium]